MHQSNIYRFALEESVRLNGVKQNDEDLTGQSGFVVSRRMQASAWRETPCYDVRLDSTGDVLEVAESQIMEATRRDYRKAKALECATVVYGVIERIERVKKDLYAFTLKREWERHETFMLNVSNLDEGVSASMTRPGDKVSFRIEIEDLFRPTVTNFDNLAIC